MEPFISQISMFGFNFAPKDWAQCDGQIATITQNQALYALLGTTFGGDGRTTFGLPDLRGRVPVHFGMGYSVGNQAGFESVALSQAEIPNHDHQLYASPAQGSTNQPQGMMLAQAPQDNPIYDRASKKRVPASANALTSIGGGQGHSNMQPYQVVNFCIALKGYFPSRN